jgi:hypothetical protein
MAIILQEIKQPTQAVIVIDPTPEQVREDDAAYYGYGTEWIQGYALIGIVIFIFLVGLLARPLFALTTIIIQLAIAFSLIYFLVVHFALS